MKSSLSLPAGKKKRSVESVERVIDILERTAHFWALAKVQLHSVLARAY
jgi:hypothetical protein